jgi:hypothetical protein
LLARHEIDLIRDTFMAEAKHGLVHGLSDFRSHQGNVYEASDPLSFYPRMMHPHNHLDKAVGPLARRDLLDARFDVILRDLLGEEPVAAQSMFYFKPPGRGGRICIRIISIFG